MDFRQHVHDRDGYHSGDMAFSPPPSRIADAGRSGGGTTTAAATLLVSSPTAERCSPSEYVARFPRCDQLAVILCARDEEVRDLQSSLRDLVAQMEAMRALFQQMSAEHEGAMGRQRVALKEAFEEERLAMLEDHQQREEQWRRRLEQQQRKHEEDAGVDDKTDRMLRAEADQQQQWAAEKGHFAQRIAYLERSLEAALGAKQAAEVNVRTLAIELQEEREGRSAERAAYQQRQQQQTAIRQHEGVAGTIDAMGDGARRQQEQAHHHQLLQLVASAEERRRVVEGLLERERSARAHERDELFGSIIAAEEAKAVALAEIGSLRAIVDSRQQIPHPSHQPKLLRVADDADGGDHSSPPTVAGAVAAAAAGLLAPRHYLYLGLHVDVVGGGLEGAQRPPHPHNHYASSPNPYLRVLDAVEPSTCSSSSGGGGLPPSSSPSSSSVVHRDDRLVSATVTKTYVFDEVMYGLYTAAQQHQHEQEQQGGGHGAPSQPAVSRMNPSSSVVATRGGAPSATAGRVDGGEAEEEEDEEAEGYPAGIGMSQERSPSLHAPPTSSHSKRPPTSVGANSRGALVLVTEPAAAAVTDSTIAAADSDAVRHHHSTPSTAAVAKARAMLTTYEQLVNELSLFSRVELTVARGGGGGEEPSLSSSPPSSSAFAGTSGRSGRGGNGGRTWAVRTLKPFCPLVAEYY